MGASTHEAYQRLFAELNADHYDSPELLAAIEQLGPHGYLLRGLARARRHAWSSVRHDMLAAFGIAPVAALTEYIAGTALVVARDYDRGMALLQRAATCTVPAVASYASKLFAKFARELGWHEESRVMLDAIAATLGAGDLDGRTRELRRRSATLQRERDTLLGTPSEAAGKAWSRVFGDGVAAANRSIDALLERRGELPELLATRVRIDLLVGELEPAAVWLAKPGADALVAERAALALARGELDEVLALTEAERTPHLLYLRGEALLGAERFGEAATTLEQARVALPFSVAIALALALARHLDAPDSPKTELEHRFADLLESAPALLADAADVLGIPLWTDLGPITERRDVARILAQARAMLTDDRDPRASHYRRPGRALRQVLPPPVELGRPSHLARFHQTDRRWIDQIHSTLVSAVGVKPASPTAPARVEVSRVWTPRSLSPEQIEQFLTDGILTIRGAFDPELARRWRDDANRRIREEPEKWVRGYDPSDEAKSLRNYSPTAPSTWTWPRLVLEGAEEVLVESFAPRAWAAICDLLGGPERIKTRLWNNYLNLNFYDDDDTHEHEFERESGRPSPDWIGWHIDDPHPAMRLDRVRNGLVCFTLVDRVLPASGSTWLCLDSVAVVARELAEHPEGVDFVHDRGARITRHCSRFHEVVGEAGDLVLMHPLMMHTGSPNRSGRIRWMGNPMVYMKDPLDPLRAELDELSPVELAIRRAIE